MKGPITMRRHITLLAALALAVSMGCAKGAPHKMGAAGPPPGRIIPVGYDPSVSGLSGAVGEVVYVSGGTAAWVRTGTNNTDWQAFPGSGGGVGGSSGVTSHEIFQQPNASGAPVNTWEWNNVLTSNVAGAETAALTFTLPLLGVQIPYTLSAINAAGACSTTTSGSTPTATLPPRCDQFTVNVGANATTLTLAGLDTSTDGGYGFAYSITSVAGTEIDASVNGSDSTGKINGQYCGASCLPYASGHLTLSDTSIATYVGYFEIRHVANSAHKYFSSRFGYTSFSEQYWGYTTVTANITSIVIPNVASGSAVTVTRLRPVAN